MIRRVHFFVNFQCPKRSFGVPACLFFWEGTLYGNLGVHVCLKDGFPKTYPVFKYTNMSYMDQ